VGSRPLKRSASAALLPTPPRTNRRRKNGKLRSLMAANEDQRGTTSSDEEEEETGEGKYKKRRISSAPEENDDDEEAFWMAGASSSQKDKDKDSSTVDTDSDSETTTSFLSRRVQKSSTMGSAPVSPPPSHRRLPGAKIVSTPVLKLLPVVEENPSPSGTSPPETPKSSKTSALKDSPNNPFLASPLDLDDADVSPRTPNDTVKERPTITYVFRGVKKTYPNPYYDHENDRPRSPDPNSLLSPEHEDYTPDLRGAPRALWPRKKGPAPLSTPESPTRVSRARRRKAAVQLLDSDDELDGKGDDNEEEVSLRPVKLFGPGGRCPGVAARS